MDRKIGEKTVTAVGGGHAEAMMWARKRFGAAVIWVIEDCRQLSARLECDLFALGPKVVRVPPKLMAQILASAPTCGKSDPIDARAVARGFLREPDLLVAYHDEMSRELKLLVDRRETLWHSGLRPSTGCCGGFTARCRGCTQIGIVAELTRDELADITRQTDTIDGSATRIGRRVSESRRCLVAMAGCGELTAAKAARIFGEARGGPIQ